MYLISLKAFGTMPCSGPLQAIKGLARQIQGALPVVGLLSRLSSPSGGIGSDILVSNQHITQPCMTDMTLCYHYRHMYVAPMVLPPIPS